MIADYMQAPPSDLADVLAAHSDEFGGSDPVTAQGILARLDQGNAELVRFECGVALVQGVSRPNRHLWLLFVDPSARGRGLGRAYMREIIDRYADTHYMTLNCSAKLRPFYGRLGFRVQSRTADFRTMQGPYRRGEPSSWLR